MSAQTEIRKEIVLVVDDVPANIDMLSTILQTQYLVKAAISGQKALEIVSSAEPPDIILLDVMMPDMDGYEVCRRLKSNPASAPIPVLFVTAKDDMKDEAMGFKVGAVDYIVKPVSAPLVLARVKAHLALYDRNRSLEMLVRERTRQLQKIYQALQKLNAELEHKVEKRTEELSKANADLERASRLKDEFLASMSHELRTPLTAILNLSEALQEQVYGPLTEKQQGALHTIEESGRHLLGLINDILDLSKIEAGKMKLSIEEFNLENICQSSISLVKELARAKGQTITFASQPDRIPVRADARRIKQILVNLLSNAIKFTPAGGLIGLMVEADSAARVVRMVIWDNGIGISAEEMNKLFQPFVQLDSSLSRQQSGTGLGLALVRGLAALHGGSISVESTPGQGSRFTVALPWNIQEEQAAAKNLPATGLLRRKTGSLEPVETTGAPLILVVDDNEVNLNTYSDYLKIRGFQVLTARQGIEAVRMTVEFKPDLVLMDIQMPGIDGLQATRQIREYPDKDIASTPVIAFTALTMPGDRERCLAAGASEYISKPVSLVVLVKTIESLLTEAGGETRYAAAH